MKPMIEVRASPIHGRGVHALRRLPRGTCIGIYKGRRYSAEALLEVDWDARHEGMTYIFELSDGTTIDGAEGGNDLRFLNHACSPNCEAEEVLNDDGTLELRLVTLSAVAAGTELFVDYRLTIDEPASPADHPCRCGLLACRGTMAAATS
jgi:SET domain-containing protein